MADVLHDFFIKVPAEKVFDGVSLPAGLDKWWTKKSSGKPAVGEMYELGFGPENDWRSVVTKCVPGESFELKITKAQADWNGTFIGFRLRNVGHGCQVNFHHRGWPEVNEHYRISCYCWAMYLRILKLNLENGLIVPYEDRLQV